MCRSSQESVSPTSPITKFASHRKLPSNRQRSKSLPAVVWTWNSSVPDLSQDVSKAQDGTIDICLRDWHRWKVNERRGNTLVDWDQLMIESASAHDELEQGLEDEPEQTLEEAERPVLLRVGNELYSGDAARTFTVDESVKALGITVSVPGRAIISHSTGWGYANGLSVGFEVVSLNGDLCSVMNESDFRRVVKQRPLTITIFEWSRPGAHLEVERVSAASKACSTNIPTHNFMIGESQRIALWSCVSLGEVTKELLRPYKIVVKPPPNDTRVVKSPQDCPQAPFWFSHKRLPRLSTRLSRRRNIADMLEPSFTVVTDSIKDVTQTLSEAGSTFHSFNIQAGEPCDGPPVAGTGATSGSPLFHGGADSGKNATEVAEGHAVWHLISSSVSSTEVGGNNEQFFMGTFSSNSFSEFLFGSPLLLATAA